MQSEDARYPSGRFFGMLLVAGGLTGLLLIVFHAPFWTFYAAPVLLAPFLLWELRALDKRGDTSTGRWGERLTRHLRSFLFGASAGVIPTYAMTVSYASTTRPDLRRWMDDRSGSVWLEGSLGVVAFGLLVVAVLVFVGTDGLSALLKVGALALLVFFLAIWGVRHVSMVRASGRGKYGALRATTANTLLLEATIHEVEPVLATLKRFNSWEAGHSSPALVSVIPTDACWVLAYESEDESAVGIALTIHDALMAGRSFLKEQGDGDVVIFNDRHEIEDRIPVAALVRDGDKLISAYSHRLDEGFESPSHHSSEAPDLRPRREDLHSD